jgi:formamidopyrimidine-DNA glycosylase
MPELPEVEVVRRTLEPHLVGERVDRVEVRAPALREPLDAEAFERHAAGRRVAAVRRRAKYLLVDLEAGDAPPTTLVLHLGMSGRITVRAAGDTEPLPHEHLVVHLAGGRRLSFRDPRRFGQAFTLPTADLEADSHFAHLGIEPLGGALDGDHLRRAAVGRRGPVKPFLMDSAVVVGVGNIYASEALWEAGVHPKRSVRRIAATRWERLAGRVREVLARAIAEGGTTLNDFTDGEGNAGYFQVSLAVYGREGEGCPRCGEPVRRVVQAGRSTFYCVGCQT